MESQRNKKTTLSPRSGTFWFVINKQNRQGWNMRILFCQKVFKKCQIYVTLMIIQRWVLRELQPEGFHADWFWSCPARLEFCLRINCNSRMCNNLSSKVLWVIKTIRSFLSWTKEQGRMQSGKSSWMMRLMWRGLTFGTTWQVRLWMRLSKEKLVLLSHWTPKQMVTVWLNGLPCILSVEKERSWLSKAAFCIQLQEPLFCTQKTMWITIIWWSMW